MKEIQLTQGKVALVDDADFEWLSQWKWRLKRNATTGLFYAVAHGEVRGSTIRMHRLIMNCPKGTFVDHIDRNGLNNTRSNLRFCTYSENLRNSSKKRKNKKYKGTIYRKDRGYWEARICHDWDKIHLGRFFSEEEAARMYDKAARFLFREFAQLNFDDSV